MAGETTFDGIGSWICLDPFGPSLVAFSLNVSDISLFFIGPLLVVFFVMVVDGEAVVAFTLSEFTEYGAVVVLDEFLECGAVTSSGKLNTNIVIFFISLIKEPFEC